MPFEPGQSGNPRGKKKGTRHKATMAIETLLEGEAETITRKAIELAKAGDLPALRLCLDRLCPPRKDRPVAFDIPEIASDSQAADVSASILRAVAAGEITPAEATEVSRLLEAYVKTLEVSELAERIARLEKTISLRR